MEQYRFQVKVFEEQIEYAKRLSEYAVVNGSFRDNSYKKLPKQMRAFEGVLGEVLFADMYGYPRPTKAYGVGGTDDGGRDFELVKNGQRKNLDIKLTMRNFGGALKPFYDFEISYNQFKCMPLTDVYMFICVTNTLPLYATILGTCFKDDILSGKIGRIIHKGESYTTEGKIAPSDLIKIRFSEILPPIVPKSAKLYPNFRAIFIENEQKRTKKSKIFVANL